MKIKITVKKITVYEDLIKQYENPIEYACSLKIGDEFIIDSLNKPKGLCDSAWETMYHFIKDLFNGKGGFFDGRMKNNKSCMISCNDGFRPVSFYIEVIS